MGLIDKIFGDPNEKIIKSLQPTIDKINSLEDGLKKLGDDDLRAKVGGFKGDLGYDGATDPARVGQDNEEEINKKLDEILPEAFALVREASRRVLGMRHYDVQLVGGMILHQGKIAEMKTGEGKTLVATLPLFLNALTGRGVQLITVNDYLSRVGAGWMAPVYHSLGLSVGVIVHDAALRYDPEYSDDSQYDERLKHFRPVSRQEAYRCDILYGTNNEFGFDYLRDNMVPRLDDMVQRELNYVIVDEIDSILIDEARTPLIISAPAEESGDKYVKFAQLVRRLNENEDYNVDEKMRAATLTESGISKMEKWLGVDNIYTFGGVREVHHIEQALKAHALFKKDRDYVVREGEVIIVDEFTGRLMHGRRYSEGLHQAIEAKEGAVIQRESQTLATITFQNYFRMYKKLSGMTGTAATEAEEFSKIYGLDTVSIPTNRPNIRQDLNDLVYKSEQGKFKAVIEEVKRRSKAGQPVLVGTVSIEKNEVLAGMMERSGLDPQVLNAKNHEKEARFIARAGEPGMVTIATNMAGRGVDIVLGGENGEKQEEVKKAGGLHVVGTERHESRRIDNQLRGRAGRQGDPGSSRFYVSMEDDLMRIFGGDRMRSLMNTLKLPEDVPIENKMVSRSIESAQKKVEGNNFDTRKHLVEFDDVINKHREAVYGKRRRILKAYDRLARGQEENERALSDMVLEMINSEIEETVSFHTAAEREGDWNIGEIKETVRTIFPVSPDLGELLDSFSASGAPKYDKAKARESIIVKISREAESEYNKLRDRARELDIKWTNVEKSVLIRAIDTLWVEHLETMSSIRQGIGLRGYGQRDPLVEYKKEAFRMFGQLNGLIRKEVVYSIFKVVDFDKYEKDIFRAPSLVDRAREFSAPSKTMDSSNSSFSGFKTDAQNASGDGRQAKDNIRQKVKDAEGKKVGRNDPCPCGSGKKYKKCCGK